MPPETLARSLAALGYAFVRAAAMREALESCGPLSDESGFTESWNHLEIDPYLAEHGRYRRRRYAVYAIDGSGRVERQAHQPHYQGQEYNQLFGGVERWFAPIAQEVGESATMTTILRWCHRLFGGLELQTRDIGADPQTRGVEADSQTCGVGADLRVRPGTAWHVEVHQFRIEARAEALGHPTPEGVHRDGVDFVLVLLVDRDNIVSGTTTVYDPAGAALGSFTLTDPYDAALVDDHRVAHGVTPVAPFDLARPGHRDVLVVTFRSRA